MTHHRGTQGQEPKGRVSDEALVRERALADPKVKTAIAGKQIVKVIYVPGRLLNVLVK